MKKMLSALAAAALLAATGAASAHVVLAEKTAAAGSPYRAVFKIGHGCGDQATTGIRVTLPPGFKGAKPMPKPGWQLAVRKDKLPASYVSHGKTVTEDTAEIAWTAATPADALPDAHYDEFVLSGTLPDKPGPLWFKVLQRCGQTQTDWSEQPASGTSTQGMKSPAALLTVTPAAAGGEHKH